MCLAQLTDPHAGAAWRAADPLDALARAIDAVHALPQRPAAAIITGDLANTPNGTEYEGVREVLGRLEMPCYVLPGNHDDRAAMRAAFALPGDGEEPIQYAVQVGELRVLMLDTLRLGSAAGALDGGRLSWLQAQLRDKPGTPTLLAMHHPPVPVGLVGMDKIGIPAAQRDAFTGLLAANPQVVGIVAGHVHRCVTTTLAGRPVVTIPSTYAQAPLDFAATELEMITLPAAFAVHALVDGRLVSHVQALPE